jgi:SSS family solute:Na+ symporter
MAWQTGASLGGPVGSRKMNPAAAGHGFGVLDWMIVVACGVVLLGIGYYFSRRQRTTEDYFVAGRNQNPILAGVSLFAALFTLVAYIGVPGEVIQNGPVLVIASAAVLPFSYFVLSRFLIPAFMRWPITSGYELLESRLGRPVRLAASITFICVRLVWMALILYAASSVLVNVTGCDRSWMPAIGAAIGVLATLYTLAGGIEAVMATAVLEFVLLLLGAALTVALITYRVRGVTAWWPEHAPPHWAPQPFFSLDPHIRVTAVATFVSYFISTVCAGGSDQVAIQRYLTTRDVAAARRAVLFGHLTVGVILLSLGVVGTALLGYYRIFPGELPAGINFAHAGDGVFPYFLSHGLPVGVSGLVVAGLLTSAVSGVSPSINSVIAVANQEFIARFIPAGAPGETKKIRLARWLALVIGGVIIAGSLAMGRVQGNLIEVSGKTVNVFFYPIFGLFFMALFVRFATAMGAIMGAIYGLTAGLVVGYWDAFTGLPKLSFQWIGPTSLLVTLVAGCLFSLLPTRGRPARVAWAWSSGGLIVLALVVSGIRGLRP